MYPAASVSLASLAVAFSVLFDAWKLACSAHTNAPSASGDGGLARGARRARAHARTRAYSRCKLCRSLHQLDLVLQL